METCVPNLEMSILNHFAFWIHKNCVLHLCTKVQQLDNVNKSEALLVFDNFLGRCFTLIIVYIVLQITNKIGIGTMI